MKTRLFFIIGCLLIWPLSNAAGRLSSDEVMDGIEARYDVKGIYARFEQTSTLKALDVTDSAEGRIFIKKPDRMRWEYDSPEKQSIITNGDMLWIYRPEDNQVMIGKAATFFGEGMGGVFLSDISAIRKNFGIKLTATNDTGDYELELTPKKPLNGIQTVLITVSKDTFDLIRVVTLNAYGDETSLTFEDLKFDEDIDDGFFEFSPPVGTDLMSLPE